MTFIFNNPMLLGVFSFSHQVERHGLDPSLGLVPAFGTQMEQNPLFPTERIFRVYPEPSHTSKSGGPRGTGASFPSPRLARTLQISAPPLPRLPPRSFSGVGCPSPPRRLSSCLSFSQQLAIFISPSDRRRSGHLAADTFRQRKEERPSCRRHI